MSYPTLEAYGFTDIRACNFIPGFLLGLHDGLKYLIELFQINDDERTTANDRVNIYFFQGLDFTKYRKCKHFTAYTIL